MQEMAFPCFKFQNFPRPPPPIHAWYIGHTRGLQPLLSPSNILSHRKVPFQKMPPHGKILKKGPDWQTISSGGWVRQTRLTTDPQNEMMLKCYDLPVVACPTGPIPSLVCARISTTRWELKSPPRRTYHVWEPGTDMGSLQFPPPVFAGKQMT